MTEDKQAVKPWSPMSCPDVNCQWHGPAAKAFNWPGVGDTLMCPKCGGPLALATTAKSDS